MAAKPLLEEELSCPVCFEIFNYPVSLKCSHSYCKACLEQYWKQKGTRECPICKRKSSVERPPINFTLQKLSDSFKKQLLQRHPDILCSLHSEKLKLFCLADEELVCVVCQNSRKHTNHKLCPVEEAALERKKILENSLESSNKQMETFLQIKKEWEETEAFIKTQVQHAERQIKQEFEKLHHFLRVDEMARIASLREEEKRKSQVMKHKIEDIKRQISSLSDIIRHVQQQITAADVPFLQNYKNKDIRAQCTLQDPEEIPGVLIDVAKHLGNLRYRVWEKMLGIVQYSLVTLDPNTAQTNVALSEDLTSLRYTDKHQLPDNPERFFNRVSTLGYEGFTSGQHYWDVEVGINNDWNIGVAKESIKRKIGIFLNPGEGFWVIGLCNGDTYWAQTSPRTRLHLKRKPQKIRVQLDYDKGRVSFFDSSDMTPIYTFKYTFTEKIFPYFAPGMNNEGRIPNSLRICPVKVSINLE
ncbi:zinc-binding protein A33 [Amia ocellicauda]|uniref:zinc-binding protein A33 n=1 Tax=Amia ocellicauda TaxID=2972642 RepID=UPI0034641229